MEPKRLKFPQATVLPRRLLALVMMAIVFPAGGYGQRTMSPRPIAIISVNVVDISADTVSTAMKTAQTVVVKDGRTASGRRRWRVLRLVRTADVRSSQATHRQNGERRST